MSQNNSSAFDPDQLPLALEAILITPELLNFVLLLIGINGMYKGIEIQHPLYSILFLNLTFAWFSTLINATAFNFVTDGTYLRLANSTSSFALYFHVICWLVTTVIRYLYILHDVWLHKTIPNAQVQCFISIGSVFGLTMALASPSFGYALLLGGIFHQHFIHTFLVRKCFVQLLFSYSLALQFFGTRISAQKLLVKC